MEQHRLPIPPLLVYLGLAVVTLALFWKTGTFAFINYDDQRYVYENNQVATGLSLQNIRWALTASEMGNWHPLTWLSHMLDGELYGLNPQGHHLTNTLLHTVNTLLLCYLLSLATGRLLPSAGTAALFALHPLHVESVAWVAERKDLLSGLFFLLTLIAYYFYVQKPGTNRYLLVVAAFILGLAAKPMLVTLPVLLLALDYWPLSRLSASGAPSESRPTPFATLLCEKVPLLLLSACISAITMTIQSNHGAMLYLDGYPLGTRLTNAMVSYATYLAKGFWPTKLAIFYPLNFNFSGWQIAVSLVLLFGITFMVIRKARQYPFLPVGWFWYLLMLLPVIGILQTGLQSRADRYTYLPLIGVFIMVTWGTQEILNKWQWRYKTPLVGGATAIIFSALALTTAKQLDHWQNDIQLYNHALQVTSNNFIVHYNLAAALANSGRFNDAIFHYQEAIRTAPDFFAEAHLSIAYEYYEQGRYQEALPHYAEVLRADPENSAARERMTLTMRRLKERSIPAK